MRSARALAVLAAVTALGSLRSARADEGMWLLSNPPLKQIHDTYHVDLTPEWLRHVQRSCVRFETGGSGSIISPDGLVMTNHHVGSDMLAKLSTPERDLMKNGFYAKTRGEELACPDLELRVLWETQDVTARVNAEAAKLADPAAANAARQGAIAAIEQECKATTGLTGQVVTLYQGGQYHLYKYKVYTDVRLVFAPEETIAFFGGDTDNFEFPRYNLDCCFFRIYENGQALKAADSLHWQPEGVREGDPIFVVGHPGRTRRGYTADHLRLLRDTDLPARLNWLWRSEVKWQAFMARSAENARTAREDYFGIQNSRKAYTGLLAGLQTPALMARKEAADRALLAALTEGPHANAAAAGAFADIENAELTYEALYLDKYILERATSSGLLEKAFKIVLLSEELAKPDAQRLKEYHDAALESVYFNLYSPEPVHANVEVERLTQSLSLLAETFSGEWIPLVASLDGLSPAQRAAEAVAKTSLADPKARRALVEGGREAVAASTDPLIVIARHLASEWRDVREDYDTHVEAEERAAYAKLAAARFAVQGDSVYPDATFTLRLTYGCVAGVPSNHTPAFTTLGGTFDRAAARAGQEGFDLPASWTAHKADLTLSTPFNFTCTADIIGGNSGSPVVNAKGEVVGLIFDGNLDSLVGDVVYNAESGRAVAVDIRGMIEAMRKVYKADALLTEILGK